MKKRYNVSISEEVIDQARAIRHAPEGSMGPGARMSLSAMVEAALRDWIARHEVKGKADGGQV